MPHDGRRRRRTTTALAGALAVGVALAGCVPGADEPETIRFHLSKPEAIPYFRELIAQYNASQDDVRVVFDTSANLQAGFLRGNPPDLGLLNYNMEMARFMERGALSDLGDMPEADRIVPEVQELVDQYATYPGRTSVLPYSVMAASVIYNKDLFREAGVEVPQTWYELIAASDQLQAAGITPFYGTFKDPWTVAQGWFDYSVGGMVDVAAFYDALAAEGTDVGPESSVSFQKDLAEPVERMVTLARDYTNPDAAAKGYGDGNLAFAQGVTCADKCHGSRVTYRPIRSASWAASTASGVRRVCLLMSRMRLTWVTSRSARRKFPLVARTIAARAAVCARPESSGSGSGRRCATTAVSSSLRSGRYSWAKPMRL